ncbi:MAG: hypothetical protein LBC85_04330 [Fibromonadaceae bacterium]|jgi:ATPase subunit of ABC transporter with duplicated ATPase domains|nr:hypothetical protein [Fibromonadaceae bacterium]
MLRCFKALNAECNILFLDEPSNHLDSESIELMLNALKKFNGIGIIISHNPLCSGI